MAKSLFLNKRKLDLTEDPITRKIQIGDISQVGERKSSFSYTIKAKKTSNNVEIFDMLGVSGNTSRKPFEKITADYVVDSVYLVLNGSAIIRETSEDFQINIIDGVRGLGELLGEKKISDLPFDDLSHVLTSQNYIDSYSNTDGFIYGIANYGRGVSSSLKVERQAPSIYTHTIFRRIFESNGLSLQGDFFTQNEKFISEVVTPSRGYTVEFGNLESSPKGSLSSNNVNGYDSSNDYIEIEEKFNLTGTVLDGVSVVGGDLLVEESGVHRLDINYNSYLYSGTYGNISVRINGSSRSYINLAYGSSSSGEKSISFVAEAGDVVSFYLNIYSDFEGYEEGYFDVSYNASFDLEVYLQEGGQLIQASDYIGEMNQIDFIKDVVNRYGLVLHPVQNTVNFRFKQLETVLNDREGAEDWTSKLSGIGSEKYVSGYAKSNKASYQYPEEIVVPNNDGEMLIDNENASSEGTLFSSSFEIPVTSSSLSGEKTYLLPIWGEESQATAEQITSLVYTEQNNNFELLIDGTLNPSIPNLVRKFEGIDRDSKSYKFSGSVQDSGTAAVCFYTAADVFISRTYSGYGTLNEFEKASIYIPVDCGIIRVMGTAAVPPELFETEEVEYTTAENEETALKVMRIKRVNRSITARLFNEVDGVSFTGEVPFLTLESMSMSFFLINNYKAFQSLINNYKKVDLYFNLSVIDIFNLDFFKLKFLKQTGRYYYVNSVKDTTGKIASVEAIEIAEFLKNEPITALTGYSRSISRLNETNISSASLLTGYVDPEFDEPLKLKFISGFNSDILLKQDGVEITSETEILIEDLNISVEGIVGGFDPYSASFEYMVSDKGSLSYGSIVASLDIEVIKIINQPPVAAAGSDRTETMYPEEEFFEDFYLYLNGSDSYDNTGSIVSYLWEMTDKPFNSDAAIEVQNTSSAYANVKMTNADFDNVGTYTFRLTVTDELGLTDTDEINITVESDDPI